MPIVHKGPKLSDAFTVPTDEDRLRGCLSSRSSRLHRHPVANNARTLSNKGSADSGAGVTASSIKRASTGGGTGRSIGAMQRWLGSACAALCTFGIALRITHFGRRYIGCVYGWCSNVTSGVIRRVARGRPIPRSVNVAGSMCFKGFSKST